MIWFVGYTGGTWPHFCCGDCGALFFRPSDQVPEKMSCPSCGYRFKVVKATRGKLMQILHRYLHSSLWLTGGGKKRKRGRRRR